MRVELTYFKPESGKFYSSATYESKLDQPWDIFHEVKEMRERGQLPDLVDGAYDFDVFVNIPSLYPALLKRDYRSDIITEVEQMFGPHDHRLKTATEIANRLRVTRGGGR